MKIQLQPAAVEAIYRGLERGDFVSDWEELGLIDLRTQNILDNAGIYTLQQLLDTQLLDLATLPNCGERSCNRILAVLNTYHLYEKQLQELAA